MGDGGEPEGLGQVTLARAGRSEQEHVFVLRDEARRGEIEDEPAIQLRVEIEVEAIERGRTVAEAGFVDATREEPILPPHELVVDEGRDEIEGGAALALRLEQASFEGRGHAGEAELAQGVVELDEIHTESPSLCVVRRSISSR